MIFNLIRTVKNIADKRIQNLSRSYSSKELIKLLNSDHASAVDAIAKIIEPRSKIISRELAINIVGDWNSKLKNEFAIKIYLQKQGLKKDSDMKFAKRISDLYADKTENIISENPYVLVRFFSFTKVDTWGKELMRLDDDRRYLGAIDEIIKKELSRGNTALYELEFTKKISKLLETKNLESVYDAGIINKRIIRIEEKIHFFGAYSLEQKLTQQIRNMLKTPKNHLKEPVEKILDRYSKTQNISLSEEQKEAIIDSVSSKIHCIVGYAGTGKSTVLSAITYIYEALGYRIEMAALSGKATLKMIQTSGKSAKTIFRFLTQVKEANAITNSGKKVPRDLSRITNNTVIILDEASMIDLGSMATIFRHLMPETRLLLVGDDFQLPPIGFGLVFHLLVKNKYLTSKLTRVFRQKESNPIPIVGKQIREGLRVSLPYYNGASIGIHFHETQEELDIEIINKICNDLGGFNAQESNLQIITATNKKAQLINNFIHKCHVKKNSKINKNTIVENSPDINFTIGDVVVFNKNNYQKNLYNGMIGYISKLTTINNKLNYLQLVFDNRTVELKDSLEINDVSLAYALTCHKLQGSQSRNIIIMLEDLDLIDPTWFYTAITRATCQVVIIGSRCQYENIFNRTPSYKKRTTGNLTINLNKLKGETNG